MRKIQSTRLRSIGAWRSMHGAILFNVLFLLLSSCLLFSLKAEAKERVVMLSYGNLDQWVVRHIKESLVIGGQTQTVYEVGPSKVIEGDEAYVNMGGSPWGTSNVMAKVAGVTKTNTSVFQERRGSGYCARLETKIVSVKVLGLINMQVLAAGSLFMGSIHEPVRGTKNPQSILVSGYPCKSKPAALRFDYKVKLSPNKSRIRSTGFSRRTKVAGADTALVVLYLQKRWEDKAGNVYAKRVGTMVHRFVKSESEWIDNATFPIYYGNVSNRSDFNSYMGLDCDVRYTENSKGENVPIHETGWASADDTPTHIIMQFTSSHGGAYIGSLGNTLWIDNVKFVY